MALRSLLCAGIALALLGHAQATIYLFTQSGFTGVSTVSGTFTTCVDTNSDRVFSTDVAGAITAGAMRVPGNVDVALFTIDMQAGSLPTQFQPATVLQRLSAVSSTVNPAPFSGDAAADGALPIYYYARVFGNPGDHVVQLGRFLSVAKRP